ncbi:MAG: FAD-binding oxidoreductase [Acidobacteria bacterium]|nr:FAD-binding oxidoreductase [Acidobacteriota bacterium]
MPGGFASGVTFPRTAAEVAAAVAAASRVLPIGAQSSLTGGATPRGDVIISTRALTDVALLPGGTVRAGAGVPLAELQRLLAARGLYYPPVPTFEGAFVGGTIATNAAGAATFKYGSTRDWVEAIRVVLADGSLLDVRRGDTTASAAGAFEIEYASGVVSRVPVPAYRMPGVPKLSAGYFARPGMDLIDLFIGSEGTLGVIVEADLRVVPLPRRSLALLTCSSDEQAIAVAAALRREAAASWRGEGPLDVSAIEYIDSRALARLPSAAYTRAGMAPPAATAVVLLLQMEVPGDESAAMARLGAVLEACGVGADPYLATPGDDRAAARLIELREAVPAAINALVGSAKAAIDPAIQKTAADFIVPFDRVGESLALYRAGFERHGLDYAIWGHLSDGNLHPNVIPHALEDVERGRAAILDMAGAVIAMGGAPLAEHGVGRSALKQALLRELYGEQGIADMRAVKRALDPFWKLAPGVLFPEA